VLNALLADTFALYLKTRNVHWHMSWRHVLVAGVVMIPFFELENRP